MSVKQITTGQDSFLDIVANLVGILIILVVVVGAQASASWVNVEPKPELINEIDELENEVARVSDVLTKLEKDSQQLDIQQAKENRLAADLTDQRHQMLMQLEIIKSQIEKKRAERLAEIEAIEANTNSMVAKKDEFERTERLLEQELSEILRESNAVHANQPTSEVIKHFPNPIAKTVFSDEVHFRLEKGKLSYVPMDELIARMKSEWKLKAEKLRHASRTVETIGPIADYRMQYELGIEDLQQSTRVGVVTQKTVSFKQFILLPVSLVMGEPVQSAMQTGSEFQAILKRHEPHRTTVSIWVYPDSYREHNQLKNWIHENGFQMASWPLDYGKKISGGPDGFKTSAQ